MNKSHLDVSLKKHVINLYERNYRVSDIAEIYQVTKKQFITL